MYRYSEKTNSTRVEKNRHKRLLDLMKMHAVVCTSVFKLKDSRAFCFISLNAFLRLKCIPKCILHLPCFCLSLPLSYPLFISLPLSLSLTPSLSLIIPMINLMFHYSWSIGLQATSRTRCPLHRTRIQTPALPVPAPE